MAERDHTSPTPAKLPLRWLRFGKPGNAAGSHIADEGEKDFVRLVREGRRELLDAIGSFLLGNDLAITPANLTFAWNAFSGTSPNLFRKISEKSRMGEKVSQEWVDASALVPNSERQDRDAHELLEELDNSVRQFTRSSTAVRSATSEYSLQLDRHVVELAQTSDGAEAVSRLASMAQQMAERTRKAEAELRVSEHEAKALRRRLTKARWDADRDHLTGLPNRRGFEIELERQHAEADAAHEPLSIAFCDIDLFKRINDRHGHDAGDRVLKLVAQVLAASSNHNCHVSRHGGEEFVLLFRGLAPAEAKAKLDRAREDLSTRRLLNKDTEEPFGQITFSAGVASVFAHPDPRDALKAADRALYRAKEAGRNLVFVA